MLIDPALVYSSYLGGSGADYAESVAVDHDGNTYIGGGTMSVDFPTKTALCTSSFGDQDCFIMKLSPKGELLFSTYLGGSGADLGYGVKSGDMSAITLCNRPFYLKPFIEPSPRVSALPWEEKLEALARLLLEEPNIRGISGVPPWILLLLKRCEEIGGKPVAELLPNLELIIHGGTSMKPYTKEFTELFGAGAPNFVELLPSSEAFMAFQLFGEEFMRFTPYYGVFFEFVPIEQLDDKGVPSTGSEAVPLEGIETGRRYAVILSTCNRTEIFAVAAPWGKQLS